MRNSCSLSVSLPQVKRFLYDVVRPNLYHGVTVDFTPGRSPAAYLYDVDNQLVDDGYDVSGMKFDELHTFVRSKGFVLKTEMVSGAADGAEEAKPAQHDEF